MVSLKTNFNNAAFGHPGSDIFWLLIWIIFILDDEKREERRRKRERAAALASAPKPPAGPRPF